MTERNNIAVSVWRIRSELFEQDYGLTEEAQAIDKERFRKILRENLKSGILSDISAYR